MLVAGPKIAMTPAFLRKVVIEAAEAHRLMEASTHIGKILLVP
jgi:hypothetical protein